MPLQLDCGCSEEQLICSVQLMWWGTREYLCANLSQAVDKVVRLLVPARFIIAPFEQEVSWVQECHGSHRHDGPKKAVACRKSARAVKIQYFDPRLSNLVPRQTCQADNTQFCDDEQYIAEQCSKRKIQNAIQPSLEAR